MSFGGDGFSLEVGNSSTINSADKSGFFISDSNSGFKNFRFDGDISSHNFGISLFSFSGSGFSFTTGSESTITNQGNYGLLISNSNTGNKNITLNGDVLSDDISVLISSATGVDFTVTIGQESTIISEDNVGVDISESNSGTKNITISGDIFSSDDGVYIFSRSGSDFFLTLDSQGSITSNNSSGLVFYSLNASNLISISGDITASNGAAIDVLASDDKTFVMSIENGAVISGVNALRSYDSVDSMRTLFDLTLNGSQNAVSLIGTGGTAIKLDDDALNDSLTITGDVTITGDIDLGGGTNDITFSDANFTLIADSDFVNFDTVSFAGSINTLNGDFDFTGADIDTSQGSMIKINGSISADTLTVTSNSTFSGDNTFTGALTIAPQGRIAPGNSIGTIDIVGSLDLENGSNFDLELSQNSSDIVTATGNINISSGATINVSAPNNISGSRVFLRSIGGVINGNFGNVTSSNSNLVNTYLASPSSLAVTTFNTAILNSQIQTSTQSSILFNDVLNDQISLNGFDEKGRNFWVKNIHRSRKLSSKENDIGFKNKSDGIALGLEQEVSENYKFGFSLAQIFNKNSTQDNLGRRSTQSTFAALYGIYNRDLCESKFFTSLSLGFGYHDNDSSRLVENSGAITYAKSSSRDYEFNTNLQAGLKIPLTNSYFLIPRLSASYIYNFIGSTTEVNGGASNVNLHKFDFSTIKLRQSLRFGKDDAINIKSTKLSPYLEFGAAQERVIGNRKTLDNFLTQHNLPPS